MVVALDLERLEHLLLFDCFIGEEWMLVATLIVGVREQLDRVPDEGLELRLVAVIEELRAATRNFQDPTFLRSTRAARRHRPEIFKPKARRQKP